MKRLVLCFAILIFSGYLFHADASQRYYSEVFKDICELPAEFNVDGQPMNLGYHYARRSAFRVLIFYFTEPVEGAGLVMYPRANKNNVEEYYLLEDYLSDPEFRDAILKASHAKTIADLKKPTSFDIWCYRISWAFMIIFFGTGGVIWITNFFKKFEWRKFLRRA